MDTLIAPLGVWQVLMVVVIAAMAFASRSPH